MRLLRHREGRNLPKATQHGSREWNTDQMNLEPLLFPPYPGASSNNSIYIVLPMCQALSEAFHIYINLLCLYNNIYFTEIIAIMRYIEN